MGVQRAVISVTTDASGDYSETIQSPLGRFLQFHYIPDGSSPLATGADLTVTEDDTGVVLISNVNIGLSAFTKAPRQITHLNTDGTADTITDFVYTVGDVTLTIAQGGNALSGVFYLYFGE